jgi:hypothetical protein
MALAPFDDRETADASRAKPRSRRSRLVLAILGMILSVLMAVMIVMQEGGDMFRVNRQGHLYSPFLRRLMRTHRQASKPSISGLKNGASSMGVGASTAPARD